MEYHFLLAVFLTVDLQGFGESFTVKEYAASLSYQYIRKVSTVDNGKYLWSIKPKASYSSSSYYLEIYWHTFKVNGSMPECAQDSVEVLTTRSLVSIGKFCSNNTGGKFLKYMYSIDGTMVIRYISNHNADFYMRYRLRSRSYSYLGSPYYPYCYNTKNNGASGILYSSGYPRAYKQSTYSCYHKITTSAGKETLITIMDLNLNYVTCGNYDFLEIRESTSSASSFATSSVISGKLCSGAPMLTFTASKNYIHVRFRRVRGSVSHRGFVLGYISYDAPQAMHSEGVCTFENDKCGFMEDTTDHFNWMRHRGRTTSQNTGPNADHSKGTALGYYLYIEASSPRTKGQLSRISKTYTGLSRAGSCLTFWYHMYGTEIGRLNVYLKATPSSPLGSPSWSVAGQQGYTWLKAFARITGTSVTVVFEGQIGSGWGGDIAIDDVLVKSGSCFDGGRNGSFVIRHQSGGLCVARDPATEKLILTKSCDEFFMFTKEGGLLHKKSAKCALPEALTDNALVKLQYSCTSSNGIFAHTTGKSLKNIITNNCIHPLNGSSKPAVGTPLVIYPNCDELRLRFEIIYGGISSAVSSSTVIVPSTTRMATQVSFVISTVAATHTSTIIPISSATSTKIKEISTSITTPSAVQPSPSKRATITTAIVATSFTTHSTARPSPIKRATISTAIIATQPVISIPTTDSPNTGKQGAAKSTESSKDLLVTITIVVGSVVALALVSLTICMVVKTRKQRNHQESVLNTVTPPEAKAKNLYVRDETSPVVFSNANSFEMENRPLPNGPARRSSSQRPLPARPPLRIQDSRIESQMSSPPPLSHSMSAAELSDLLRLQSSVIPNAFSDSDLAASMREESRKVLRRQGAISPPDFLPHNDGDYISMKTTKEQTTTQDDSDEIYDEIHPNIIDKMIEERHKQRSVTLNDLQTEERSSAPVKARSLSIDASIFASQSPFLDKPKTHPVRKESGDGLPPIIKSFEKPSETSRRNSSTPSVNDAVRMGMSAVPSRKASEPVIKYPFSSPCTNRHGVLKEVDEEEENYLAPSEIKSPLSSPRSSIKSQEGSTFNLPQSKGSGIGGSGECCEGKNATLPLGKKCELQQEATRNAKTLGDQDRYLAPSEIRSASLPRSSGNVEEGFSMGSAQSDFPVVDNNLERECKLLQDNDATSVNSAKTCQMQQASNILHPKSMEELNYLPPCNVGGPASSLQREIEEPASNGTFSEKLYVAVT